MDQLATPLSDLPKLSVDALTATIDAPLESLVQTLSVGLNAYPRPVRPLPKRGYDHAVEFAHSDTERVLCRIEYGQRFTKPNVFAEGTESYNAPETYRVVQGEYRTSMRPSRIDVALDFEDPLAFDVINEVLVAFALRSDIKLDQAGDWSRGLGRTRYLYSRAGQFFLRLYEYRIHHGYGPAVRLELEIKMKGDARSRLALIDPWRMLFMCPATLHVLQWLGLADGPRISVSPGPRSPQTIDRDVRFLANTAWPALSRLIAHHAGDMAAAVRHIAEHRSESEETRLAVQSQRKLAHVH